MAVYVRLRLGRARFKQARFVRLAEQVLTEAGESESELSIELVGDRRMRRLNRVYRRKDRTTDVLAFPMRESDNPCPTLLGDVVISVETAKRQAREYGVSLREEVTRLIVHGTLHLLGYRHERVAKKVAARMQKKEAELLEALSSS